MIFNNKKIDMKIIVITLVALFFVDSFSAQTDTRELEDFSSLKVMGSLEVRLVQGTKNEAIISIPGTRVGDIANVKTEVVDGVLSIYRKGKVKLKNNIVIVLTFKELNRIHQSGASEISTLDVVREEELKIYGSGAIEADLNLEVTNLSIEFSGASDLKLRGLADNFNITTSGASDVKAASFVANHIVIDISGASDIKVNAIESITGKARGASSVSVTGSPILRTINSEGASSIRLGKQHLNVLDNDDVDIKLGNKGVIVKDYGDTVRVKWGHTQLTVLGDSVELKRTPKKRRSHWAGVDLAINGYVNSKISTNLSNDISTAPEDVTQFMGLDYTKSWAFAINFAEWYVPIKNHHFGFVTGLGSEWNNYELKYNIKLNSEGGDFVHSSVDEFNQTYTWGEVDTLLDYSKNRFKTWFINAPLLFVLNTGNHKNKSFHLSAGAIFGFNLQTKMKYKYRLDGDGKKDKDKQSFNTIPFRISATIRGGVGRFNLFATYSLTPLFESGRGPELYPFTVGVTLLGF
tara:strand:- start:5798 stop:7357 length:1560 start_codon:yes stop_codon:yes gene_type:complete